MRLRFAMALLVALLASTPVVAQVSDTHGFSIGLHVQGAYLDPEDDLNDTGGGAGLDLAYGFRNHISIPLTLAVAAMQPEEGKSGNSYALTQVDLGVRYTFRDTDKSWRPFAEAAITGMVATFQDVIFAGQSGVNVEITGPGFSVGGGVEHFFSPGWSGSVGLRWSAGSFDEVRIGNVTFHLNPEDEFDVTTTRLQIGGRYYFSGD